MLLLSDDKFQNDLKAIYDEVNYKGFGLVIVERVT